MTDTVKPAKAIGTTDLIFFEGMMSFTTSIVPVKKSGTGLKLCCPACDDATKLDQRYICSVEASHGPYEQKEAHRAIEVDGMLRKVTAQEILDLKAATIADGEANFSVYHASDVEKCTMASGSLYRLRPKTGLKPYSMLVDLLKDESLAFVCEMTFKGGQKMYRCISRDGMLWLRELIRPHEFHAPENVVTDYPGALLEAATKKAEASVKTFDPVEYENVQRRRLAQLEDTKRDPNAPKPEVVKPVAKGDDVDDLVAMLQASIDNAEKKPRKRTAKKVA